MSGITKGDRVKINVIISSEDVSKLVDIVDDCIFLNQVNHYLVRVVGIYSGEDGRPDSYNCQVEASFVEVFDILELWWQAHPNNSLAVNGFEKLRQVLRSDTMPVIKEA